MRTRNAIGGVGLVALVSSPFWGPQLKPLFLAPAYEHDKYGAQPADILRHFDAFTSSFDSGDDDNGDGLPDTLGIPQWVAYEIRRHEGPLKSGKRPRSWSTDEELAAAGLAPTDDTYRYSKGYRKAHPNWFERGHLAMKYHAERIGQEAARETHTMLNAVPQRGKFNRGIWKDLECRCGAWANKYGAVWIVTGPVFYGQEPAGWLGEADRGERLIAIPDALFKVVIREAGDGGKVEVLGFIYPQEDSAYDRKPYRHEDYLARVDSIEALTGLDLLTGVSEGAQREVESVRMEWLWPVEGRYFTEGCKKSRSHVAALGR